MFRVNSLQKVLIVTQRNKNSSVVPLFLSLQLKVSESTEGCFFKFAPHHLEDLLATLNLSNYLVTFFYVLFTITSAASGT